MDSQDTPANPTVPTKGQDVNSQDAPTDRSVLRKGQGIIGIYYEFKEKTEEDKTLTKDINIIRYLHLLRRPLSTFVEKHVENNEFTDWRIAENTKRLLLLSGHGKEMLRELAKNGDRFKNIVLNLEHLQVIFLLNESARHKDDSNGIQSRFDQFYRIEKSSFINKKYIEDLEDMARVIYDSDEVEIKIDHPGIKSNHEEVDFEFPFSTSILDVICFEIFINAKKNRWIFSEITRVPEYLENKLEIHVEQRTQGGEQILNMQIKNTGPLVPLDVCEVIDSPGGAKPADVTAGTTLIKTLLHEFKLGSIKYSTEPIIPNTSTGPVPEGAPFAWFIVTMQLKKMY